MNDLQKFLNDFLDFSNRNVLFATIIALIVILIALISCIRRKKKKKKLNTKDVDSSDANGSDANSSDGTEFNEDEVVNATDDDSDSFSKDLNEDSDSDNFSEDEIVNATDDASEDFSKVENSENFSEEDFDEENFSTEDFDEENAVDLSENNNEAVDDSKEDDNEAATDPEMEELLNEDGDDLYSAEMIENFFGNLGKQEIGSTKDIAEEVKKSDDAEEAVDAPVELILHDQISVDEKESEEEEENKEEEVKHTAITLVDGSDRVMVSIGEKFEAKHTKNFTIEVKDEPEITIAMQDGFVFDGRIHFFVSLSEALAKHVTLKDVTEIVNQKGSYSGYEIKLEVTDKGDLESIDCTRSFNYKKVKDAVLIIQLSLE